MKSLALIAISLICGPIMAWVMGKVSDQEAIRQSRKRLVAYIMELRLFIDEPGLVWQAQKNLFKENIRHLFAMLRPALVLILPVAFLMIQMDSFFGNAPAPVGSALLVTAELNGSMTSPLNLEAPRQVAVETPGVYAVSQNSVVWRVRPTEASNSTLRIGGVSKQLVAGQDNFFMASERPTSWWGWIKGGGELPTAGGILKSIRVEYPAAAVRIFGWSAHWSIWFLVICMASAFISAKMAGITV